MHARPSLSPIGKWSMVIFEWIGNDAMCMQNIILFLFVPESCFIGQCLALNYEHRQPQHLFVSHLFFYSKTEAQ